MVLIKVNMIKFGSPEQSLLLYNNYQGFSYQGKHEERVCLTRLLLYS